LVFTGKMTGNTQKFNGKSHDGNGFH
jgi:hypothetical protein